MPRENRKTSISKVYHVIIRGINKQDILLDKQDFLKFIEEVERTKEKYKYEIYSYALMNDHVHFVIYDKNENMSIAIQSLNISYSIYFNKKYERTGHLFENRFKSKVVESEEYLKSLVRYIHKNPENAGLKKYEWTSYYEYLYKEKLINRNIVLNIFGEDYYSAINNFKYFHQNYSKYQDYDKGYELLNRITDEEAIEMIKYVTKEENLLKIQQYSKKDKEKAIMKIIKIEGITKVQIARIIGISTKTICKLEKRVPKRDTFPIKKRP